MPTKKFINTEDKLRQKRKKIRMRVSGKGAFAILEQIRAKKKNRVKK